MSLLDTFTGGKSKEAIDALKRAEAYFGSVRTPSQQELTLPELQKYVEAGIMTPAEAQAYLQQSNAFADMSVDQTGTQSQVEALNRLSEVADAGPEGTPMQQAQMENAISRMNTSVGGQRGAIEQSMAARGTPYALIQAALSNQTAGQEGQQAHLDAVNAQAAAYQTALNAMSQGGQLGGQLQGQQNQQANTVAQAQNAMQQFNAQNQQQVGLANAGFKQDANTMNSANKQQVSNNNTGLTNARTQYNSQLPQQVFNNAMAKAQGQAGAASNIGQMQQNQGQQNAGIWGGIINTASSFIPKPGVGGTGFQSQNPTEDRFNRGYAHGGIVDDPMNCADGAIIPGESNFPGDSEANDTVPIQASPGEAVIPRSSVAENPEVVSSLIQGQEVVDPQDVATMLKALRAIRMGAV